MNTIYDQINGNFDETLELAVLMKVEQEAESFADFGSDEPIIERELREFSSRQPISSVLQDLKLPFKPVKKTMRHLLETYRLQKVFSSIADLQKSVGQSLPDQQRFKGQMTMITEYASQLLHHLYLLPEPGTMQPITLSADTPESMMIDTDTDSGDIINVEQKSVPNRVSVNSVGQYTVWLDKDSNLQADVEIGTSKIMVNIPAGAREKLSIKVYFNGITTDCQQDVQWIADDSFYLDHELENPQLMNVTVIDGKTENSKILIFWAGIEKELISAILEKVFPDPRFRLAWWWNPLQQLGGWTPVQCIQRRREDLVLDYLFRRYDIAQLADLS